MKTKTLVVLLSCIALTFFLYVTPSANAASAEEEVLQVQINFDKAITTGDFELMSSLYWHSSKTSTFYPVDPPFLAQGWDESLENLWKSNSASATGAGTIIFHHPQVTMLKDDVAVITGYEYIVNADPTTKEQTIGKLRVTRVVQKIGDKWLIVHDHVSAFPTD